MSASSDDTPSDSGDNEYRSGGIDVEGDASVGGDVAGRDVVKSTTVVGYSEKAVLRLVIVVGAMVFVTAACFFTGGIVLGSQVFAALERPVNDGNGQPTDSTRQKAEAFARGARWEGALRRAGRDCPERPGAEHKQSERGGDVSHRAASR